ncbi:phospholipid/cholesterol/gamma-HCH transport system substrate-binding protein [Nocardioides luteus]|uniref:ABC transporter substrate-binding protein n=1 Tax=Nocardioides luteus TaxID=1844 RepID=A0ABQ5T2T7_9ACTN|nr:MlaD family protein [Nocardioides luteus]MDR7310724.1 phospholipid/cholesterol/gamma-HCH transport system substrate-binding protein [Nocardioides luteus]GGR41034.1 ABC transporter substrate-binding protein [Nocardioides luteus]GLJ69496.1 ABC transporter substrate-binding protein [Nocardioides luteus]
MTRSVRNKLVVFLVIAAVGIFYVSAAYLGLVDRILGRHVEVSVDLPASGGLYVGSEVNYRGLGIGRVSSMTVTDDGVRVGLELDPGTEVPRDAAVEVHNLSAVGEQYINFIPESASGPYLAEGDVVTAGPESMPGTTDELLTQLDSFTTSINGEDLSTVVAELGTLFRGNAENLRTLLDSGSTLVDDATKHQKDTIRLLDTSQTVLKTQKEHSGDIREFADGLEKVTATLDKRDPELREILEGGEATALQVQSLVDGLQPLLPVFLANLSTVNEVLTARLPAIEQTLVTFPRVVATGWTGSPGDGYGHLSMGLVYTTPPCQKGYKPPEQWIPGTVTEKQPLYPAKCTDKRAQPDYEGDNPIMQRGVNMVPKPEGVEKYVTSYDPKTGRTRLPDGKTVTMSAPNDDGGLVSALSDDSWRSMILGEE